MMEVLHGITDNENTVKYLSQRAKSADGSHPSDYQSLKEKLLQQVGSKAFLESTGTGQASKVPKEFQDRKLLTSDFVTDFKVDSERDFGPLSCVPVASQESAIVQDLLFCFVGINGVHIKPVQKKVGAKLSFEIDPKVNPTLRELLKRMTPLCNHYSVVVAFVERHTLMGSGCVNQALAQALAEVLKDYYVFVAQLETQHRLGELTLNKMWSYIQPTMDAMGLMSDLCMTIDKCNARGGKTLSLLHEKCVTQSLASTEKLRDLGLLLTRAAAVSYFEVIWPIFRA
jgi:gamma-tubulin complex component 2